MLIVEEGQMVVKDSGALVSSSGAYAELAEDSGVESLKVYASDRKLVFEYNPASGKTSIYVPTGDLEFVTQQGDIIFNSARCLSLTGQAVRVSSRASLRLAVTDVCGKALSSLTLRSRCAKLAGSEVAIAARRGDLQIDEVSCSANGISVSAERARLVVGRLERFANCVIEKAKNVYSTVDGVVQVKAGRMRTLLEGAYHFKAKRAYLKAQEDFKVNAEKIHLG